MSRTERGRISPDYSTARIVGGQYGMEMHYLHQSLSTLQRLPDVSIRTGAGLLEPGKECEGIAFVPKSYFPEHMLRVVNSAWLTMLVRDRDPEKMASMYLKYLLERKLFSTRSKLAQSAWEIYANFGIDPYLNFEVEINEKGFYFPLLIKNHNPLVTFLMPNSPFPAFRFFLPSKPLVGQELLEQVKLMQSPGLVLEEKGDFMYRPHEFDEAKPTDPLLFEGSDNPLISVIVPMEKEGEFTEKKVVDMQELFDCPSTDRSALDNIWGLKWRSVGQKPSGLFTQHITISESSPLVMPAGIAGVIDHQENRLDTERGGRDRNHGIFRHITSPLIDPKFGLPNGQPIRFEHYNLNVTNHNSHYVRMFLYHSN